METFFRPVDLARALGISTNMVRKYQQWGFLPPVERSEKGYRHYRLIHLHALQTARLLAINYGWEPALHIMQNIHREQTANVLTMIDAYHADLHHRRQTVEATLKALRKLIEKDPTLTEQSHHCQQRKHLQVHEVAQLIGVRTSSVRFWEERGLLHPQRASRSKYRLYDEEQVLRLQIVVLLRQAEYDFDAIHAVLAEVERGHLEQAVIVAERRLHDLLKKSEQCSATTAAVWSYLQEVKEARQQDTF